MSLKYGTRRLKHSVTSAERLTARHQSFNGGMIGDQAMEQWSRPVLLSALAIALSVPLTAHAGEVRNREANQQGRIGQGIASGQITAGGAQHLEQREANINQSRDRDLAAHGGHLTNREYNHLNRRENALSGSIYRDKHNDTAQPGVVPAGAQ